MSKDLLDKKLEYWEHRLLDVGKRNKMINYRETKRTTMKLVEPSFSELFDRLALNEEELTFQRSVDRETDIRVFSILSLLENLSSPLPVTIGDIKAEGSVIERQKTLKNLRSKARLALEEQGTNILYLSFGFIEWKDGKDLSVQWIKSPLILVPVALVLEAMNSPYTLSKYEDDIVVNPTLEYYLKTEYGIELPQFDSDKETLDDYLTSLEVIADQRGWRIIREVSLGLLSFQKITMYNDLLRNEERIKKNPVIRAMSGDNGEVNNIPEELQSFKLDSIKTQDSYQVMSADSSQQDAILYSKNNISFVMQGPPGTGKSQTITNIIAEALADGKKVLFVSEKMAALQVVYRRLEEAHLADFCLPLHSYKANKKDILEQIGANLNLKQTRVKDTAVNSLEELSAVRQELNKYAAEIHKLNPELNISCYEIYSKLENVNDAASVNFSLDNPLEVSQALLQLYLNKLKEYSLSLSRLDYFIKNNPWDGLPSRVSGYEYSETMRSELENINQSLLVLIQLFNEIFECGNLAEKLNYEQIIDFTDVLNKVCILPLIPNQWLSDYDIGKAVITAEEAKQLYIEYFQLKADIAKVFHDSIYNYGYNEWKQNLLNYAGGFIDMPFISEKNPEYYIENSGLLLKTFSELKDLLTSVYDSFVAMNNLLGTSLWANASNHSLFEEIYAIIKDNAIINKNWFDSDTSHLMNLILEAKEKAYEFNNSKKVILNEWEAEALNLDFPPILSRYKTEYTSMFKIFNSQYRQDKKQIQILSKNVLKKLPDDVAVSMLSELKTYHEKASWFVEHNEELKDSLCSYYKGIDSDWDGIIQGIQIVEKLNELPLEHIPAQMIDFLAVDHKEQVASLAELLSTSKSSFEKIKGIISNVQIEINIDDARMDVGITLKLVEEYISKLQEMSEQSDLLTPYLVDTGVAIDVIYKAVVNLNLYTEEKNTLKKYSDEYKRLYDFLFTDETTNWDNIIGLLNKFKEINQSDMYEIINPAVNNPDIRKQEFNDIRKRIISIFTSSRDSFNWVQKQYSEQTHLDTISIRTLKDKVNDCLNNISILGAWIDYQEAKDDCLKNGLGDFIGKIEFAEIYSDIEKSFLKGFYKMWLEAVCNKSDSLRRFRRNTQDERIKKFIELDDLQLMIAQMRIRENLIESLPSTHHLLKATDEVAILNKELSKKRNIMPLRKLFRQIPNLLMKLKPCLMMSPLSVSYFLETEAYNFDLVIFDEASQIFPEDAIGAIFRGSQVVIAGDSKQLPPTNFFASTTNNSDGDYDITEEDDFSEAVSDSILEESAGVLPNRTLLWHYRSKDESLIAFSNREIYKNSLITFPNSISNVADMGVQYIYVENGCYEGGGKNCNIKETQKCVILVFDHIQKYPERSLGIIAFSEKQQTAIENAIIDFRKRMPQYEWFFDESKDEPFFVKNLENVQGDERDTIIFSICYGKDNNGKMYMRFGPLGHQGGERRLNVAITRAKCNIKLVGSILPSDIDLSRTDSEGVRMLRSYIEFARKGASALKPVSKTGTFETVDEFCDTVANFLDERGYKIIRQVGCSDYKIDIAIENPNVEGEYIAGIECDGISYVQAKTARDREHLRKTILENMGWNLYRVWSTEWFRNPQAEKESLLAFIRSAFDNSGKVVHEVKQSNEFSRNVCIEEIACETSEAAQQTSADNPYGFEYYREANWWKTKHSRSHDDLTRISENVYYIVSIEQPIHLDLLYKRMRDSFTTGKATERVKSSIDEAIEKKLKGKVEIDKDNFVRLLPLSPVKVRIPKGAYTPRPIEYIHTKEVATAIIQITKNSYGITEEDLVAECVRCFGFERKGPKIKAKTDVAIRYLEDRGIIKIIDGKAQWTGESI